MFEGSRATYLWIKLIEYIIYELCICMSYLGSCSTQRCSPESRGFLHPGGESLQHQYGWPPDHLHTKSCLVFLLLLFFED